VLAWPNGRLGFFVSSQAWRRTLHACGCTDEHVVRYAVDLHRRFSRETQRLFVDAVELLAHLAASEIRVALVTNGPSDVQRDHLRTLGLEDVFGAVVISGEVGVAKPDPALFRLALQRLGVQRQDAWHIGDSLALDVRGAQAAGVFAVWLNRNGRSTGDDSPSPDLEVSSLTQVVTLLRQAQPGMTGP
jgi:HAD superfamily hydrolase (TIGR01549 family)